MYDERYNFVNKICPVCGKNFVPAPMHIYKIRNKNKCLNLVCTYGCMISWEKKHEKRPRKKYARRSGDEA